MLWLPWAMASEYLPLASVEMVSPTECISWVSQVAARPIA